ncbi:MAG: rhomboid family intramembrane serine protease [Nitriliruptoraceae bacterium]
MLPIGDVTPTSRRAVVVWLLTLANLAIFLAVQVPLEGCAQQHLVYRYAAVPRELTTLAPLSAAELEGLLGSCAEGVPPKNIPLSLVTSLFLHGGLAHLLGNLLYLVVFGNNVEDRLGHARFVLFYAVGGAAATLSYTALRPGSTVPLIGASGAIAGVLGAYLVLHPSSRILTLVPFPLYVFAWLLPGIRMVRWWVVFAVLTLPAWLLLGGWFVLQFNATQTPTGDMIAYEAHVGGFLAGILLLLVLDSWRSRHGHRPFHERRRPRR